MLQVSDESKQKQLEELRDYLLGCVLCLYQTTIAESHANTAATYTAGGVECSFSGYARIDLDNWGSISLTADYHALIQEQIRVFTFTSGGGQYVYGYFVLDADGDLAWAEENPAGPTYLDTPGNVYVVLPRYTTDSENEI
jgi:hypothetical protein